MIDSIIGTGLKGVQLGLQNAARDAQKVTEAFNPENPNPEEATNALVNLKLDEHQTKASSKVIQVGKKLLDSVLDIFA